MASSMISDYQHFQATANVAQTGDKARSLKWRPPELHRIRINVDGAVKEGEDRVGIGTVVRNSDGVVLGCLAKSMRGKFAPFVAELLAAREGVRFASDVLKIKPHELELDAVNVVKALASEQNHIGDEVGLVVTETRKLLKEVNPTMICKTIAREGNYVAHILANAVFFPNINQRFVDSVPYWIHSYV